MTVPRRAGVLAGLLVMLACALPAVAAAAPTVGVRIEGERDTLLQYTRVTLGERPLPAGCANPSSALAALDAATGGNFQTGSNGVITRILGETHDFSRNDYWAFWVGREGRYASANGPCDETLREGEELEIHVDFSSETFSPTVFPLAVEGVPATVEPGIPFTVTVVEFRTTSQYGNPGEGQRTVRPGATVTVGGQAATTGEDGRATLTLSERGAAALRAVRGSARSTVVPTCVTDGADGACGTSRPGSLQPAPVTRPAPCVTTGKDGLCGTRDTTRPVARIAGLTASVFASGRAPRELRGTVGVEPSGLAAVKLRLTRRHAGRCSYFSARKETFRRARCGRAYFNRIGDRADWSYLMPETLEPGRYVLDVVAIDKAGNRSYLQRNRNRWVFTVR